MSKIYKKICIVVVVSFVVIFVILKLNIINIFSCPKVTAITFSPPSPVPIGTSVTATMVIEPREGFTVDSYSWGGDFSGVNQTSDALVLDMGGDYEASATINWSGKDKDGKPISGSDTYTDYITSYFVESVTTDTPIPVIVKGSTNKITLTAVLYPSDIQGVGDIIQWQRQKDGGAWEDAGTGMSKTLNSNEAGLYYYRARAGDHDTWVESNALAVLDIELSPYPYYMCTNSALQIKASLIPANAGELIYSLTSGFIDGTYIDATGTIFSGSLEGTITFKVSHNVLTSCYKEGSLTKIGPGKTGPNEIEICALHPEWYDQCFETRGYANSATEWAESKYPRDDQEGLRRAARHAAWMCMTAKSFGVDFAHQIGLGHEQTEDNDCFNKIMGANNSDYGAYVLGADPNVTNCYDAAKEAVNNGKLITY